jgi:hypothetical protein
MPWVVTLTLASVYSGQGSAGKLASPIAQLVHHALHALIPRWDKCE